ncbi:MAG TPA: NUDIX hydrolase [Oligoflexus sp.]|uniref:NUDIX hydrolase n=1 Tax=Oligoflexus sp. TaxID=1971216 RepID=UPI002D6B287A|nr:NUDIX hydrolase [Oligoflexus sp.]HYX32804.1 NUDIX hydrolase [Oligoflexus sp.]
MHRQRLLALLDAYEQTWARGVLAYSSFQASEERDNLERLRDFVRRKPDCFERSCLEGHITASALVTDPRCQSVLLTLHAKLNKWLQLGGHVDGDSEVPTSALREAQEESGREEVRFFPYESLLTGSTLVHPLPFDLDIHRIPARKQDPEHFHFDVRFLCSLDPGLPFVISEESHDLRWLSLSDAQGLTDERSMQRQFHKLQAVREKLFTT